MSKAETADLAAPDVVQHDVEPVNKPENRTLYKARVKIHPKRVWGTFRKLKWLIMALTLGVYYITPWIRWDRGAGNPDQAVLIDFPHNRFYFFFIEIWPQEVYYFAGMLIMAAVGLFFITSVVGRAWCGHSFGQSADVCFKGGKTAHKIRDLAFDIGGNGRCVDFLFRRRADVGMGFCAF